MGSVFSEGPEEVLAPGLCPSLAGTWPPLAASSPGPPLGALSVFSHPLKRDPSQTGLGPTPAGLVL